MLLSPFQFFFISLTLLLRLQTKALEFAADCYFLIFCTSQIDLLSCKKGIWLIKTYATYAQRFSLEQVKEESWENQLALIQSYWRSLLLSSDVICTVTSLKCFRDDICRHSYAVERGLVVGFCGQPHYCYRPYYPTARFPSPSSYMVSD